ncbi:hypothetical protein JS44_14915 [Anoxybacillus flavithermus]|uniref:Uncharacterized protein n=1 Tax=Anoxybacillus flavithermus TaxID=33934 RepID=A0A094LBE4_9BACL|nr:hypothetical protein JS44_14915 [Anoxybacillus flavithermus]
MNELEKTSAYEFYLLLLERTIQLKEYELFEQFGGLKDRFDRYIGMRIAHLLYENGFIDLAIEVYRSINDLYIWDAQAFVNMIEGLTVRNEISDAIQYGMLAFSLGHKDFRLYKYVIELMKLNDMKEEMKSILRQAQNIYPDSKWLMNQ